MDFRVYSHKQQPNGLLESPQTNLGFAQTPQLNQGLSIKQGVGIGIAAARIIPAGKQVFNTVINATGNKVLKRTVEGLGRVSSFGTLALSTNIGVAAAVEGISMLVSGIQNTIQDGIDQINQDYQVQKRGVSVNKFIGVGERID